MIWKEFFSSLPWQDLVPDQDHTVVTAGLGTYGNLQTRVSKSDFCTAAKTPDGSFVIAYMPTARTITVNMASLRAPASAKWFDPTNGAYTAISGGPFANTGTRQFTPPGKNQDGDSDWVLLLAASNPSDLDHGISMLRLRLNDGSCNLCDYGSNYGSSKIKLFSAEQIADSERLQDEISM